MSSNPAVFVLLLIAGAAGGPARQEEGTSAEKSGDPKVIALAEEVRDKGWIVFIAHDEQAIERTAFGQLVRWHNIRPTHSS